MGLLSIPHLIVIFIVALVAFGPEKLPELARNLGKIMADLRRASNELRGTLEGHMQELEREARELEQRRAADMAKQQAAAGSIASSPKATETIASPETHPVSERPADGDPKPA